MSINIIDNICMKYYNNFGQWFKRLNLKPILALSPNLKQVVTVPTRRNPDTILDLIVTNLSAFYQPPFSLQPLDNDAAVKGTPSDHLIIVTKPLCSQNPSRYKRHRIIKYRPFPGSGIREMGRWIQSQSWKEVYSVNCPEEKVKRLELMIMEQVNKFFPEKTMKVNENDKPWVDTKLLELDRSRKREYNKRKKSPKWQRLNTKFLERAKYLKESY